MIAKIKIFFVFVLYSLAIFAHDTTPNNIPRPAYVPMQPETPQPVIPQSPQTTLPPTQSAPTAPVTPYFSRINWKSVPILSRSKYGGVLGDILAHATEATKRRMYDSDLVTCGHETSHGIHADERNKAMRNSKVKLNAFYIPKFLNEPGGKVALIKEPPIRKSAVGKYIPQNLRYSRYKTYITGAKAWDDRSLYVWDEWNAYVNGGAILADLKMKGSNTNRKALDGLMEFNFYAIAVGMAAEKEASQYYSSNPQFKEFLGYNLKRSMDIYKTAIKAGAQDSTASRLLNNFRNSNNGLKEFVRRNYGEQYLKENFIF